MTIQLDAYLEGLRQGREETKDRIIEILEARINIVALRAAGFSARADKDYILREADILKAQVNLIKEHV